MLTSIAKLINLHLLTLSTGTKVIGSTIKFVHYCLLSQHPLVADKRYQLRLDHFRYRNIRLSLLFICMHTHCWCTSVVKRLPV